MLVTLLVIAGPTCSGKTAASIAVALRLGTSIVSADSRQCYQGMSIGTAQPTQQELHTVPHFFINEFPVTTALSVAGYEQLALDYIHAIHQHNDVAIVCGGTGLYIKALTEGIDPMPAVDPAIDTVINEAYAQNGLAWLQQEVQQADPLFYAAAEVHNPARLIRALVFYRSTGHSILAYRTGIKTQRPFRIIKVGLELPREVLYTRINHRVDAMMEQGLLAEVQALFPQRHLKNLHTVGYSELFDHLEGKYSLAEAVDKIKQHTRNYAKRQLTWFRRDADMHWFMSDKPHLTDNILRLLPA
ncbi:MAG: tRNA (adenosine(37)-N6)-dimethylallyltransferase MiaA [Chitinophagia bacterium]|nr:tRNA (adenosine(37)-N6)-dimethylallyltransferase MiaA [Chitinophagia bacterium]